MKHRLVDFQPKTSNPIPTSLPRSHRQFADMVDKLPRIIPNVRDVAQSAYEFTIEDVLNAVLNYDLDTMREISNYFWKASSLYKRLLLYFATLHKFYWLDIPTVVSPKAKEAKADKLEKIYYNVLNYIQKFRFADTTPDILIALFIDGAFYGYLIEGSVHNSWQQLPIKYCRSRYKRDGIPVVEFNIRYFEIEYTTEEDRQLAFKQFPKEFKSWYNKYKNGTIRSSTGNEVWVPLDDKYCTRFALYDDEAPPFFALIPEIIRLSKNKNVIDEQALQQLFKLLVQKMPLNKNDDLIFDVEETKAIHRQASNMLANAPGVDLFTTWADVEMLNVDTTDSQNKIAAIASPDSFWAESGTSPMLFATGGNISLNFSQAKDSAIIFKILESYATFINMRLYSSFNMKQVSHHFKFIDVTEINRKEMINLYKEQATLGYSKLLTAIAMGINQAELPSLLDLENNTLKLGDMLIPLASSYTASSNSGGQKENTVETEISIDKGGRPVKDDTDKSDKTIENINA